ncbi:hypothetical protein IDVR_20310 [Intrasporangium sp. DVR]
MGDLVHREGADESHHHRPAERRRDIDEAAVPRGGKPHRGRADEQGHEHEEGPDLRSDSPDDVTQVQLSGRPGSQASYGTAPE